MKKIISIIISVTLLLICFSGCGKSFKQGDVVISDDANVVGRTTETALYIWRMPGSFGVLNYRFAVAEKEGELPWDKTKSIIFKGTPVGKPIQIAPELESIGNYPNVLNTSALVTPVKIEEIYYSGDALSLGVEVGDIVYAAIHCSYIIDDKLVTAYDYPNFNNFISKVKIGDYWTVDPQPFKKEMLLKEDESYLLFMLEDESLSNKQRPGGYFDSEGRLLVFMHPNMVSIFNLTTEPVIPEEITDGERKMYDQYIQIRKDAIDYYINGNKEIFS